MTLRHEWLLLRRDRAAVCAVLLLSAACAAAIWNGTRWRDRQHAAQTRTQASERAEYAERRALVAEYEVHPPPALDSVLNNLHDPTSPYVVGQAGRTAQLPLPSTAAVAAGQLDVLPVQELVSLRTRQRTVADKDALENPLQLAAGPFDLAFVIVYLLPLILLALTYNLVSLEREEGTLGLLRCQAGSLWRVMLGRALLRTSLLVAMVLAAVVAAGGAGDPARLALIAAIVVPYALFWAALALFVNAYGASSSASAARLALLWLAAVAIVPAALHLLVDGLRPVPSRLELLEVVRNQSIDARRDAKKLVADWYAAHPEFVPSRYAGSLYDTATGGTLTHIEQDRRTLPLEARFQAAVAARQDLVSELKYFSPAIVASEGLLDAAGTSLERYRDYKEQVRAFREVWLANFYPLIFRKQVLRPSDYDTLPTFHYRDYAAGRAAAPVAAGSLAMLAATAGLMIHAARRLG